MKTNFLACYDTKNMINFVIKCSAQEILGNDVFVRDIDSEEIARLYATEIWQCWAGDHAPEEGDKDAFSDWIGPELAAVVIPALGEDFWTQEGVNK